MKQSTREETFRLRILILDDEPIVCKRLKPAFQKLGYEVETYTDSAAALARIRETRFDIVITDLKMEAVDGMQILTEVKATDTATHVIIITGFATMETARESYRQGAFDFVAKPFKIRDILECVQKIKKELQASRKQPNKL